MEPPTRPRGPLAPLVPGDPALIGGYRVLARLGPGRTGPAYLAATQSGRRLAIRTAGPALGGDEEFRRRFKREIAAAQRARGRYLAAVVDGHADGAFPWVASEYVPGPSLARAMTEAGPLPAETVRILLSAVTEALHDLHDAGIAHGDLRPSKVLLTDDGPRLIGHGSLERGTGPGDDVPALGRLALFALTGDEPSPGVSPDLTSCPDELREPIERCLASDPPEPGAIATDPPGPGGWLPPGVAALLPAYQADPPPRQEVTAPRPTFAPPEPHPAPAGNGGPNFALPVEPAATVPAPIAQDLPPVMDSYRHDLVIALGIGGGAFGLLVLILLLLFLI